MGKNLLAEAANNFSPKGMEKEEGTASAGSPVMQDWSILAQAAKNYTPPAQYRPSKSETTAPKTVSFARMRTGEIGADDNHMYIQQKLKEGLEADRKAALGDDYYEIPDWRWEQKAKARKAGKVGQVLGVLGNSFMSGLNKFNEGLVNFVGAMGANYIPGYDAVKSQYAQNTQYYQESAEDYGEALNNDTIAYVAKTAGDAIGYSLPSTVVALMSGGTSVAATGTASLSGASSAAATGTASAIKSVMKSLVSNPSFWMSAVPTYGNTYEEAKEEGASDLQAQATAILNGFAGAVVEIGGGIEKIPMEEAAIKTWVKGMLDEGTEEVLQGIIEQLAKKAVYDQDKEWWSLTDPEAVVNPKRSGEELLGGAIGGAVLGGGEMAIGVTAQAIQQQAEYAKIGMEYTKSSEGIAEAIQIGLNNVEGTDALEVAKKVQQQVKDGKTPSAAIIGRMIAESVSPQAETARVRWNTVMDSAIQYGANRSAAETMAKVAVRTGRNIRFASPESLTTTDAEGKKHQASGSYDEKTDTITLSAALNKEQATEFVIKHEMTHAIEGSRSHAVIEQLARQSMGDEAFDRQVRQVREQRSQAGDATGTKKAKEEVIADWVGNNLFKSNGLADVLLQHDRPAAMRLYSVVYNLRRALGANRSLEGNRMRLAELQFMKAIRSEYRRGAGSEADIATADATDQDVENSRAAAVMAQEAERGELGKYTYAALTAKPDMKITLVGDSKTSKPTNIDRKNTVDKAIKNAISVGRSNKNGNAVIHVTDIDTDVIVHKRALRHGLDRRFEILEPITLKAGEILKNAVRVNEMSVRDKTIDNSYILIGAAKNKKNELSVVTFVVNRTTNEVETIDILYSMNTKREPAGRLSPSGYAQSAPYFTGSTISISDLLAYVNWYFPDILPEDVLRHFGHTERPAGELGKSALYSFESEAAESEGNSQFQENGDAQYSFAYQNADVNEDVLSLIQKVKSGNFRPNDKAYLGVVSDDAAQAIQQITGINVDGWQMALEARQIEHILKRHGENGKADHSMADDADIAKMEYILNHADSIADGGVTKAYKTRQNQKSATVLYEKKNGQKSYYIVQAVPDTNAHTLYILTAYMGVPGIKRGAQQVLNAQGPKETSENELTVTPSVTVSQTGSYVNTENGKSEGNSQFAENGDVQYSILQDVDGEPYVQVDGDIVGDAQKDGVTLARKLRDIIAYKFHNLIQANGQNIGVNQTTNREWTNSKNASGLLRTNLVAYDDKIRAFNNADELLQVAKDWVGEEKGHKISQNKFVEYARGVVRFRVGDNGYIADVVVGITKESRAVLYDIVNLQSTKIIEDAPDGSPATNGSQASRQSASPMDSSVPQTGIDVNPQNMEKADAAKESEGNSQSGESVQFSFMNDLPLEDNVADILSMTNEEALKRKEQGQYIRVMDHTPRVILNHVEDASDCEIIIRFDAAYLAARHDGALEGHYHNYGENFAALLTNMLNDPDAIIRIDNGRLNVIGTIVTQKGNQSVVSVELNAIKDINSRNTAYNLVVSMLPARMNYLKNLIGKRAVRLEYEREGLPQVNPQLHESLSTINGRPSKDIIPQTENGVNPQSNAQYAYLPAALEEDGETAADMEWEEETTVAGTGERVYRGRSMTEDGEIYRYDFLTALPDMRVTELTYGSEFHGADGKIDTMEVARLGMENARAVGTVQDGKVFVRNRYSGRKIRVSVSSIRHGLNGDYRRLITNSRMGVKIGELVKNAVPINALKNKAAKVDGTYAMAAYARDDAGREYIGILTIEERTGEIAGMETYETLHAVSGRQKASAGRNPTFINDGAATKAEAHVDNTAQLDNKSQVSGYDPGADGGAQLDNKSQSTKVSINDAAEVSIADVLQVVKRTHQSILSEDVLKRLGEIRNPNGDYYYQVQYAYLPTALEEDGETAADMEWEEEGEEEREAGTGEKVRGFTESRLEGEDANRSKEALERLAKEAEPYDPVSNKETLEKAQRALRDREYSKQLEKRLRRSEPGDMFTDVDMAAVQIWINDAMNDGDIERYVNLVTQISRKGTEAGRAVQILSLQKRLTPEGTLRFASKTIRQSVDAVTYDGASEQLGDFARQLAKEIEKAARETTSAITPEQAQTILEKMIRELGEDHTQLKKLLGKIIGDPNMLTESLAQAAEKGDVADETVLRLLEKALGLPTLNNEDVKTLTDMVNTIKQHEDFTIEQAEAIEELYDFLGKKLSVIWLEKWQAWRKLAMLANPKTHIRNMASNVFMGGVVKADSAFSALLERVFLKDKSQGTAMAGWSFTEHGRQIRDVVEQAAQKAVIEMQGMGKYNLTKSVLKQHRRYFKTEWLNRISEFNSRMLEKEDMWSFRPAYKDALGQIMTVRGMTQVTQEVHALAMQRALEATFRADNALDDAISSLKHTKNDAVNVAMDIIIPFSKTPTNILTQSVLHSPIGLVKATMDLVLQVRGKSSKTTAAILNEFAKGLTGSLLWLIGMLLGVNGLFTTKYAATEKERADYELEGKQENSLRIGGVSISMDWLQPTCAPLIFGASLGNSLAKGGLRLSQVFGATMDATDSLFSLTMLQSLYDVAGGYNKGVTGSMASVIENLMSQSIPTVIGQAARAIDPVQRRGNQTSALTGVLGDNAVTLAIQEIMLRIPGLTYLLEPEMDVWGDTVYRVGADGAAGALINLFQQFISPTNIKTAKKDDSGLNEVLTRLYNSQAKNHTAALPSTLSHDKAKELGVDYRRTYQAIGRAQRQAVLDFVNNREKRTVQITEIGRNGKTVRRKVSKYWREMTDEERLRALNSLYSSEKEQVQDAYMDALKQAAMR